MSNREYFDELYAQMRELITESGHMYIWAEGIAYSIGMSQYGLPDVLVMNASEQVSEVIINATCDHMREHGEVSGRVEGILTLPVYVGEVENSKENYNKYMVQARNFYVHNPKYVGENGVRFVQVLWSDEKGLIQYEAGFNDEFRQTQVCKVDTSNINDSAVKH